MGGQEAVFVTMIGRFPSYSSRCSAGRVEWEDTRVQQRRRTSGREQGLPDARRV